MPQAPGNVVIGARCIATNAKPADNVRGIVESEPAAKDNDAAEMLAHHRIRYAAELKWIAAVKHIGRNRIAVCCTIKRAARLRARIEVCGRNGEPLKTEAIRGVGFFGGNAATAGPLIVGFTSAERHGADAAIAGNHRSPFVVVETAIARTS